MDIRIAMMAITTRSSIRVNAGCSPPLRLCLFMMKLLLMQGQETFFMYAACESTHVL